MFKKIRIVLIIVSLLLVIFSAFKLFSIYSDKKENKNIQNKIKENVKKDKSKKDYTINNIEVDFENLKSINPDTVGYIEVKNTNISYAVVKGNDNEYYLYHNFYKEDNVFGWIFADYRNKLDGKDKNLVIYGHNTETRDMFTSLENVLSEDWYTNEENLYIPFSTKNKNMMFKVFSVYTIEPENYYIETEFKGKEFFTFIGIIKSRSIYDFKTKVKHSDHILTLSTCHEGGKKRTVLHAVRIS